MDPLQHKYLYYTPYQYAGNKPITFIDLDGLEPTEAENINQNKYNAPVRERSEFNGEFNLSWDFASDGLVATAFSKDNPRKGYVGDMKIFWNPEAMNQSGKKGAYMWQKKTMIEQEIPVIVEKEVSVKGVKIKNGTSAKSELVTSTNNYNAFGTINIDPITGTRLPASNVNFNNPNERARYINAQISALNNSIIMNKVGALETISIEININNEQLRNDLNTEIKNQFGINPIINENYTPSDNSRVFSNVRFTSTQGKVMVKNLKVPPLAIQSREIKIKTIEYEKNKKFDY